VTTVRTILTVILTSAAVAVPAATHLTREEREHVIARAQVWNAGDIASKNLLVGPEGPGAFERGALVPCDYVDKKLGGATPKFVCRLAGGDEVKVKFGGTNGEVYAEVAATRLLWALGFPADAMYPVRVVCRGCPPSVQGIDRPDGTRLIDPAAIERKLDGKEVSAPVEGWAWKELDLVREDQGGAPREQREALVLLAAFIQHSDNKTVQQRLLCESASKDEGQSDDKTAKDGCASPVMMINDLGVTFGRANFTNNGNTGSMNLEAWSKVPVWRDPAQCVANLSGSYSGTLKHPRVSESGRRFLADRLAQLTDNQLRDLFTAARVELRTRIPDKPRSGLATVDEWVGAFQAKRAQIVDHMCGPLLSTNLRH